MVYIIYLCVLFLFLFSFIQLKEYYKRVLKDRKRIINRIKIHGGIKVFFSALLFLNILIVILDGIHGKGIRSLYLIVTLIYTIASYITFKDIIIFEDSIVVNLKNYTLDSVKNVSFTETINKKKTYCNLTTDNNSMTFKISNQDREYLATYFSNKKIPA